MAGKGLFIVLEGIDGSGKDTHLKLLAGELRELGYAVVETAEPSGGGVGTFLKRYANRKEERLVLRWWRWMEVLDPRRGPEFPFPNRIGIFF